MKKKCVKRILLPLVVAATIITIQSCSRSSSQEEYSSGSFILSPTLLDSLDIEIAELKQVEGVLLVNGKVQADENKMIKIFPTLSGYATQIKVQLGDYVNKGQLLAVIHSGEIAQYENQLADAQSTLSVAEKKLQVERDLLNSQLATARDVADAESEVLKAKAAIKQVKDLFSIYKKGSGATYHIVAPISGYIIQKSINDGMEIRNDNNESIFTISEINDVWVIANVFESDIPKVGEGNEVIINAISYPNQVFTGKIDKVYNFLDPETKTMQARIKVNNEVGLLKPEMFASVKIHYPSNDSLIAIPSTALVFDNNTHYVLVLENKQKLSIREVSVGSNTEDVTYIRKGLAPGEKIVAKDQLLLYNALLQ